MRIVVVGGSASNVGKTRLACRLIGRERNRADVVALKVSVREADDAETVVRVLLPGDDVQHRRDTAKLIDAGARAVVWVTAGRVRVRDGLAQGLATARTMHPGSVVIESTSAGIELHRYTQSWFVAGDGPWKPWADRHRVRADIVVPSADVESRALD